MGIGARLSASKGPGSSHAKPICLSDTDTPSSELPSSHTPDVPEGRSDAQPDVRRSLCMQAQWDTDSVLKKAQKRKQGEGSSSLAGMSLVSSFLYSRLTLEQIISLFEVYQIRLGNSLDDSKSIITGIQHMDRSRFEVLIKHVMCVTRDTQQSTTLSLVDLENDSLENSRHGSNLSVHLDN